MNGVDKLSPETAWSKIKYYREQYYDDKAALYSGDHDKLESTSENGAFWKRKNKCRIHVPLASDIASTSSNLMFSQEPTYTIFHEGTEESGGEQQKRLEDLLMKNDMAGKLNEAAETCAALGDVYIKLRWNTQMDYPLIDIVQPDQTWPEYLFGRLRFVHFFTDISVDIENDEYIRAYECYEPGKITMRLYKGDSLELGSPLPDSDLKELGYAPEIKVPIDELLAVHIANIRPNRIYRTSMLGRSDFEGLRDMFDALDEAFTSWMRDIRLAKARLIIPAEYLRARPSGMDSGLQSTGMWEFDEDVETYVALDINTDTGGGTGITPSQFAIRSAEHQATCTELVRYILQTAGYSPNTFGFSIEGAAASGTALNIRERKSAVTKNKKLTYWQYPLEYILTTLVRLDHALYPKSGSDGEDTVNVAFADSMGADLAQVADTVLMLTQAGAISTLVKLRMVHPDWSEQQVNEEAERIRTDAMQAMMMSPDILMGAAEQNEPPQEEPQ